VAEDTNEVCCNLPRGAGACSGRLGAHRRSEIRLFPRLKVLDILVSAIAG
jgi:hypothetical protein